MKIKEEFPKRKKEVFQFNGTLTELKTFLLKEGFIDTQQVSDCFYGVDLVEVAELNTVFIGQYEDIQQVIKEETQWLLPTPLLMPPMFLSVE
jgi:hypothetical protein